MNKSQAYGILVTFLVFRFSALEEWRGWKREEFEKYVSKIKSDYSLKSDDDLLRFLEEKSEIKKQQEIEEEFSSDWAKISELLKEYEELKQLYNLPDSEDKNSSIEVKIAKIQALLQRALKGGIKIPKEIESELLETAKTPRPMLSMRKTTTRPAIKEKTAAPGKEETKSLYLIALKQRPESFTQGFRRQLASVALSPLRILHLIGSDAYSQIPQEELINQGQISSNALTIFLQFGLNSKNISSAIKRFNLENPQLSSFYQSLFYNLGKIGSEIEKYETSHPLISNLVRTYFGSENIDLSISQYLIGEKEIKDRKIIQINFSSDTQKVLSILKISTQKGVGLLISKGKEFIVKPVKAYLGKIAAQILIKLGLTAVSAALTGGTSLIIQAVLAVGLKLFKKLFGPVLNKIREVLGERTYKLIVFSTVVGSVALPFILFLIPNILLASLFAFGTGLAIGLGAFGIASVAPLIGSLFSSLALPIVNFIYSLISSVGAVLSSGTLGLLVILAISMPITSSILSINSFQSAFLEEETFPTNESKYISLSKSASPQKFDKGGQWPKKVTWTVTVTAKEKKLVNIKPSEQFSVLSKNNPPPKLPTGLTPAIKQSLEAGESETVKFSFDFDQKFEDSLVTNYLTVTADVEGGPVGEKVIASATVVFGDPPSDCPSIWPTDNGIISQGPGQNHQGPESIDILTIPREGAEVKATHKGTATTLYQREGYGYFVDITGICGGVSFTSRYAHLLDDGNKFSNKAVERGDIIGHTDCTGDGCHGPHLHYELIGLKMEPQQIPVTVPRDCGDVADCNVRWPK